MEKVRITYLRLLFVLKLAIALSLALLPLSAASGMVHATSHAPVQTEASSGISAASEHCPRAEKGKMKPSQETGKADKTDCCKTFCAAVAVLADTNDGHPIFPRFTRNFGPHSQLTPGELAGLHRPPRA